MVVIATGLVLIVEGMARSQQALSISRNMITASRLIEEKMMALELEARQGKFLRSSTDSGKERVDGRVFQWKQRVSVYPDSTIVDQSKVNQAGVEIQWKEGPVRQSTLAVETLFLNREKKA